MRLDSSTILCSTNTNKLRSSIVQNGYRQFKQSRQCFPAMADWDFSIGSQWKEFDQKWKARQQQYDSSTGEEQQEQQRLLLQEITKINGKVMVGQQRRQNNDNNIMMKEPITIQDIDDGLSAFVQIWNSKEQQQWDNDNTESSQLLSKPFLYSDSMDNMIFIERYLPFFRHIFRIDPSCCGTERPDPDESVFVSRSGDAYVYMKKISIYSFDTKSLIDRSFSLFRVVV